MRSEEGVGGLGTALSARGPSRREKLSAPEVPLRRESPRRDSAVAPVPSFSDSGAGKPREEKRTALSKVVLRRLPPGLTKEQLEEQLRPLPAHDYFEVVAADFRAYINFRNPDDILLFRDRFDGYIFIGNKGLEYPAVVEFAPFQKIAKKKLKKKDAKTGSIEDDPEYKQFLETYSLEEEKTSASPETLLGEIEVKTRELLARRTTPLLEYIKNRKLEKQRIREEKREERRRREMEKKRLREEEKRKRREEESCKRKEADRQKRAEKEVKIKLLKKLETEEATSEKSKERGDSVGIGDEKQRAWPVEGLLEMPAERLQDGSDKEQRDKRFREKEPETPRCHPDGCRKHSIHSEFARFSRRNEDEPKWGKGFTQGTGKKGSQDGSVPMDKAERRSKEQKEYDSLGLRKERPGNKVLTAV
ncbi:regulator of nonsense transcripts 3A isoform X2 [Phodopus roborovskii]|uniref:regulator of nonsense transcripts 3A isoform X2 n=1 Tax=Phodopus roborovskii TaxID=109678 RepID=UPI0021E474B2|nr:regulator of nonsense transcripts 3A isoform X2 [Phodopus roborovskii]